MIEDLQNTGIELIKIDVTKYLISSFYKAKLTNPTPYSFKLELEDSVHPAVPGNLINYIITGDIFEGNRIFNITTRFCHDLTYSEKDPETKEIIHHETECVFNWAEIEKEILNLL